MSSLRAAAGAVALKPVLGARLTGFALRLDASAGIHDPETKLPMLLATFLTGALVWTLVLSLLIALARRFVNAVLFRIVSMGSALVFIGTGLYTIWQVYLDSGRG